MTDILPFDNAFVVKRISGAALLLALENSLSDAHTDGRFLQVSGLRIVATWRRPSGRRLQEAYFIPPVRRGSSSSSDDGAINQNSSNTKPQTIDPKRLYSIAMVSFIADGFDGYSMFSDTETLVGEEGAMTDTRLLLQIFGYESAELTENNPESEQEHELEMEEIDGDDTSKAIERARQVIVVGTNENDGLPVVEPVIDGRIKFIDEPTL